MIRTAGIGSVSVLLAALFAGDNVTTKIDPSPPVASVSDNSIHFDNLQFNQRFFSLFKLFRPNPYSSLPDNEYALEFRKIKGFEGRDTYIKDLLQKLNPQLLSVLPGSEETALSTFNKKHGLSLVCAGIKNKPAEFVFIDNDYFTGKNPIPRRIAITIDEAKGITTKQDTLALLEKKIEQDNLTMSEQHKIWSAPYSYSIQKNSTCMLALTLTNLSGMESDLLSSVEIYTKNHGMTLSALCIDKVHIPEFNKLAKERDLKDFPEIKNCTRDSVLSNLEGALIKAIDQKKTEFLFHYMTHGGPGGDVSLSESTSINGEDIGKVISKPYKGKPICEQIDITLWGGTCYSVKQLNDIKGYFQARKELPVKNLRIIGESTTTSGAGTKPYTASLVLDSNIMQDKSGPLDYYRVWYYEHLNFLKSKGMKSGGEVGTYLHEIRFADLMGRFDTWNNQDAQGFHYSNNPATNEKIEKQFTQFVPKISNIEAVDNLA